METLRHCSSLHGYFVLVIFLATASRGSACEAPSSPQCFKRTADDDEYTCEWSMNNTGDVTFDLFFEENVFRGIKDTCMKLHADALTIERSVDIWLKAHVGSSICTSHRSSVVLVDTVKYEAPQISVSWLKNNLSLNWTPAENYPALAEVLFRRFGDPNESWNKLLQTTTNTTNESLKHQVCIVNLLKNSVYMVKIRQQSTQALNPLWSGWSPVVTVPAELEEKLEVVNTTGLGNGTRTVTLTWKPVPYAAAFTGVNYSVVDTQSSRGCSCVDSTSIQAQHYITYVSYSVVNISVIAKNSVGSSPPAVLELGLPAEATASLKACDSTLQGLLARKRRKKTCLEFYELHDELQEGDLRPANVITVTSKDSRPKIQKIQRNMKDYVRYLYFENKCNGWKPQTVKMCLVYKREGVPSKGPQDFVAYGETHNSADLSWKAIPTVDRRGFLTHYSLCSVQINSQDEPQECHNISASLTKYRLENLKQATKYNISLAGVTQIGDGPKATVIINTLPEKPMNVLWSLGLLLVFFLISTICTCILKRIKNRFFPPVPRPVIQDFPSYPTESQEILERKEVVHELTLHQLQPEVKSLPEVTEETTFCGGEWDQGTDQNLEGEEGHSKVSGEGTSDGSVCSIDQALRSSREEERTDLEPEDNEITMLIYRNGLVFDVKTDSP